MGKIKKLTPDVYGKIAAGEVIERPVSIVRELIDNAIDAKADKIQIELEWEKDFIIRITDDGEGIHPGDMPLVIEKHATSKIRTFDDIYQTSTHGFRGEALSSIVSVARVEINSCVDDSGKGCKLIGANSKIEIHKKTSHPKGTSFLISEIFASTPVRKKFLRSAVGEKNEIKKEIIRQILGAGHVQFIYRIKNGGKWKEEIVIPQGYGLKEKIAYLFNKDISENLIEIKLTEIEGFSIKGFISSHHHKAKTRKDQYFLVKNRVIQNASITMAFNAAYTNVLPVRKFPACFLFIEAISSFVDINVHPQKKEVRFEEKDNIYRAIYHGVKEVLYQSVYSSQRESTLNSVYQAPASPSTPLKLSEKRRNTTYSNPNEKIRNGRVDGVNLEDQMALFSSSANKNVTASLKTSYSTIDEKPSSRHGDLPNFHVLGQIGKVYIVYTLGHDLYIADQHAIHERLNFDKLKARVEKDKIDYQFLLVPLTIEKNRVDMDIILERANYLESLGVTVEQFGENIVKVEKIPTFIPKGKEMQFVNDLFDLVIENKYLKKSEVLEKILSTIACRMSLMAGDKMTLSQMEDLIYTLYADDYIHNCPHGRPFVKKISFDEMSRFFDRH